VHLLEIVEEDGKTLAAGELLASQARRSPSSFEVSQFPCQKQNARKCCNQAFVLPGRSSGSGLDWRSGVRQHGGSSDYDPDARIRQHAATGIRHYDSLLTQLLDDVYRTLERRSGVWAAWRLSREAARLNTIRLDVMELTEKVDNAIKFLSDMFICAPVWFGGRQSGSARL